MVHDQSMGMFVKFDKTETEIWHWTAFVVVTAVIEVKRYDNPAIAIFRTSDFVTNHSFELIFFVAIDDFKART